MNKRLLMGVAIAFPVVTIMLYTLFLLCTTAPVSVLSIEKAGQFGDSFGIATSLFTGLAFSGVLITLLLQREALNLQQEEIRRSINQHAQSERLNALSALLVVYQELADKKQAELIASLGNPTIPLKSSGKVEEALQNELNSIYAKRNKIYDELESAAGLN